ncbi:hypothetical protein MMC25_001830 [Agyrium rufum]|nr:hypothetical protein [Agyrium rufum]
MAVSIYSSPLHAVTVRIKSTPSNQLAYVVPFLVSQVLKCKEDLSAPSGRTSGRSEKDVVVLVHRLKTQISSLLQAKIFEERWAGAVLAKAAIDAGGEEMLQASGPWVRMLLGFLNRPDPLPIKELCVWIIIRIFQLGRGSQSLSREIVTPSLPAFITNCLNIITIKETSNQPTRLDHYHPALETVLAAFIHLLPHHPSAFRPFLAQIHNLVSPLLAPTPSYQALKSQQDVTSYPISRSSIGLAHKLYVLLAGCAPKNAVTEEISKSMAAVIRQIHRTADLVFRGLIEDSTLLIAPKTQGPSNEIVQDDGSESDLKLPPWRGVHAGTERLAGLIRLLGAHISFASSTAVVLPVGHVWAVTARILSVIPPQSASGFNPEIEKDERDAVVSYLPSLHIEMMEVLELLVARVGLSSATFAQASLELVLWSFSKFSFNADNRAAAYSCTSQIFDLSVCSFNKSIVTSFSGMIQRCCDDSIDSPNSSESSTGPNGTQNGITNSSQDASSNGISNSKHSIGNNGSLRNAATELLRLLFSRLRSEYMSSALLSKMQSTAVLLQDEEMLLTSVLNHPRLQVKDKKRQLGTSLLPFLARAHPDSVGAEAILKPRVPLSKLPKQRKQTEDDSDEEDITQPMETGINGQLALSRERPYSANNTATNSQQGTASMMASLVSAPSPLEYMNGHAQHKRQYDTTTGEPEIPESFQTERATAESSPTGLHKRLRTVSPEAIHTTSLQGPLPAVNQIQHSVTEAHVTSMPTVNLIDAGNGDMLVSETIQISVGVTGGGGEDHEEEEQDDVVPRISREEKGKMVERAQDFSTLANDRDMRYEDQGLREGSAESSSIDSQVSFDATLRPDIFGYEDDDNEEDEEGEEEAEKRLDLEAMVRGDLG